jgi:hypothetical protein
MYDSDVWHPDDDMITDLFRSFKDDPTQHFQDDFCPSLGSCDADLFCEDFQPLCSDIDRDQVVANPGHSEVQTTKRKYFHIDTFGGDLQIKKQCFLSPREEFISRHEVIPYLLSSSPGSHVVFFRSFISSQSSTSGGALCVNEN